MRLAKGPWRGIIKIDCSTLLRRSSSLTAAKHNKISSSSSGKAQKKKKIIFSFFGIMLLHLQIMLSHNSHNAAAQQSCKAQQLGWAQGSLPSSPTLGSPFFKHHHIMTRETLQADWLGRRACLKIQLFFFFIFIWLRVQCVGNFETCFNHKVVNMR